jgi:hypothetical protein
MPERSAMQDIAAGFVERNAPKRPGSLPIEIVEGLLLAIVAVTTAWSGYQSTLWDTRAITDYGTSSKLRIASQGAQTTAGQQMLYDSTTFDAWLVAAQGNNTDLANFLERRFRPEYKVPFDAWLATDPLHDPSAPPGPAFMPQYTNAKASEAAQLDKEANHAFDAGNSSRGTGDEYVRITVLLAVVLFLTAIGPRFNSRSVRLAVMALGVMVLAFSIFELVTVAI